MHTPGDFHTERSRAVTIPKNCRKQFPSRKWQERLFQIYCVETSGKRGDVQPSISKARITMVLKLSMLLFTPSLRGMMPGPKPLLRARGQLRGEDRIAYSSGKRVIGGQLPGGLPGGEGFFLLRKKKACTLKKNVAFAQKKYYSDDWVIWSMASGRESEGPDTGRQPRTVWPDARSPGSQQDICRGGGPAILPRHAAAPRPGGGT